MNIGCEGREISPDFPKRQRQYFAFFAFAHMEQARRLRDGGLLASDWRNTFAHNLMAGVTADILAELTDLPEKSRSFLVDRAFIHDEGKRDQKDAVKIVLAAVEKSIPNVTTKQLKQIQVDMRREQERACPSDIRRVTSLDWRDFDKWEIPEKILRYTDSTLEKTIVDWRERIAKVAARNPEQSQMVGDEFYGGQPAFDRLAKITQITEAQLHAEILKKHPELAQKYAEPSKLSDLLRDRLYERIVNTFLPSERVKISIPNFDLSSEQREALHRAVMWTKEYFNKIPTGAHIGGHGFDKTMRQVGMAAVIAYKEGHPIFLPVLTAIVMDVGRATTDLRSRNFQHAQLSREIVEADLFGLLEILTPEDRELVGNAIEDHSKLNENVRRSYVVEDVMDADRLDCLGTLGPLRSASWLHNLPLILPEETETSLVDGSQKTLWQDMARQMEWVDMLWTKTAKEIAKPRVQAYREYLKRLQAESSFSYKAYQKLGIFRLPSGRIP